MAEIGKFNAQEMPAPPPYQVGQPTSGPGDDIKSMEAGPACEYPPQAAGYPTQSFPRQPAGYPAQAYNPQQGYPLQPYPQANNNVVVVGQPAPATVTAAPTTVQVQQPTKRAKDFLIFSVILMLLCYFLGGFNGLLTVPAIFCSLVAQDYNRSGNYTGAKQYGYMALGCNIAVIVCFVIEIIITVIVLTVVLSSSSYNTLGGCRSYSSSRYCNY